MEYKSLEEEPVEGFRVKLVKDEDMFVWEVALFGPPDTLYQGGYFKVTRCYVLCKVLCCDKGRDEDPTFFPRIRIRLS